MQELALAGDVVAMLLGFAASLGFPPVATGAFWTIVGLYGVVSVLFDDENPRGVPGIEYLYARRPHLFKSEN